MQVPGRLKVGTFLGVTISRKGRGLVGKRKLGSTVTWRDRVVLAHEVRDSVGNRIPLRKTCLPLETLLF